MLFDKIKKIGIEKVVEGVVAAEKIMTEAKAAAEAERKRQEEEQKRR